MLPPGLEAYFEVEEFQKDGERFWITLREKNELPGDLGEEYRGRKVAALPLEAPFPERMSCEKDTPRQKSNSDSEDFRGGNFWP